MIGQQSDRFELMVVEQMGFIDDEGLRQRAEPLRKSGYGDYLLRLLQKTPHS